MDSVTPTPTDKALEETARRMAARLTGEGIYVKPEIFLPLLREYDEGLRADLAAAREQRDAAQDDRSVFHRNWMQARKREQEAVGLLDEAAAYLELLPQSGAVQYPIGARIAKRVRAFLAAREPRGEKHDWWPDGAGVSKCRRCKLRIPHGGNPEDHVLYGTPCPNFHGVWCPPTTEPSRHAESEVMHCLVTGNPCGTDTVRPGEVSACLCLKCVTHRRRTKRALHARHAFVGCPPECITRMDACHAYGCGKPASDPVHASEEPGGEESSAPCMGRTPEWCDTHNCHPSRCNGATAPPERPAEEPDKLCPYQCGPCREERGPWHQRGCARYADTPTAPAPAHPEPCPVTTPELQAQGCCTNHTAHPESDPEEKDALLQMAARELDRLAAELRKAKGGP